MNRFNTHIFTATTKLCSKYANLTHLSKHPDYQEVIFLRVKIRTQNLHFKFKNTIEITFLSTYYVLINS